MQKMDHRGQIKQPITYFLRRRQQNLPSYKSNIQTSWHIFFIKEKIFWTFGQFIWNLFHAKANQMTWPWHLFRGWVLKRWMTYFLTWSWIFLCLLLKILYFIPRNYLHYIDCKNKFEVNFQCKIASQVVKYPSHVWEFKQNSLEVSKRH